MLRVLGTETALIRKVLVVGDSHANAQFMTQAIVMARENGCDAIWQLGDFGYWPHTGFGKHFLDTVMRESHLHKLPILWIDGNHEDHSVVSHDSVDEVPISEYVTYLPRGYRFTWQGLTVLALGGAISVDRAVRTPGLDWFFEERITHDQIARALTGGVADVILTHDVANRTFQQLRLPDWRLNGWAETDILASEHHRTVFIDPLWSVAPKYWFSGHYHQWLTTTLGRTQIRVLDCEYPVSKSTYILESMDHNREGSWYRKAESPVGLDVLHCDDRCGHRLSDHDDNGCLYVWCGCAKPGERK